jgi:acetyltransferase EpsM
MVILFGAGGHGKVLLETLLAMQPDARPVILDDSDGAEGRDFLGFRIAGDRSRLAGYDPTVPVIPAIGTNAARADLIAWLRSEGRSLHALIHPRATVSPSAVVEPGAFIAPGAVVNAATRIEAGAIVNTSASVDHDGRIGFCAHVAPGARLCGGVEVGARALVGTGSSVIPGIRIGIAAMVGAGSVVIRDVPDGARVAGNPARLL